MEQIESRIEPEQIDISEIKIFLFEKLNDLERSILLREIKNLPEAEQKKTLQRFSRMNEEELNEHLFVLSITSTVQESVSAIENVLSDAPSVISKAARNRNEEEQREDKLTSFDKMIDDINNL